MRTRLAGFGMVIFALISTIASTTRDSDSSLSSEMAPRILSFATRSTNDCSERQTSGLICKYCNILARCVRINDKWETIVIERCDNDAGQFCNVASRGCSNATGPCNPTGYEGNFSCTSEGIFPDPYDCQKYHMCYPQGHNVVVANIECGGDRAFSAATGDCSLSLNDSVCSHSQYQCHYSGESHPWPGNPNIFYICHATYDHGNRVLYPAMYRCGAKEVFNGSDCIRKKSHGGDDGDTFVCRQSGLFGDTSDCKAYYYCDYSLKWKRYTCEPGSYFDNRTKACMRGNC